jgi:hypothetical protein
MTAARRPHAADRRGVDGLTRGDAAVAIALPTQHPQEAA